MVSVAVATAVSSQYSSLPWKISAVIRRVFRPSVYVPAGVFAGMVKVMSQMWSVS